MAGKALEIHPSALDDLKSSLGWYLERSDTAAVEFSAEVDRAVARRSPKAERKAGAAG
jgi:hypothetical protein